MPAKTKVPMPAKPKANADDGSKASYKQHAVDMKIENQEVNDWMKRRVNRVLEYGEDIPELKKMFQKPKEK